MTPKIIDRDKKKEKMILKALKTVAEIGLSNFTMQHLADELSMGKATLYDYFNSKNELIIEMSLFHQKLLMEKLQENLTPDSSAKDIIEGLVDAMKSVYIEGEDFLLRSFLDIVFYSTKDENLKDYIRDYFKEFYFTVKNILDMGKFTKKFEIDDVDKITLIILGILDSITMYYSIAPELFNIIDLFDYIKKEILPQLLRYNNKEI